MMRTHTCGELNISNVGHSVVLTGWVYRHRNHGGIIFIDLRDRYGHIQIKFDPIVNEAIWSEVTKLRREWVIRVAGDVKFRPNDMINPKIQTGEIEIAAKDLMILGESKTLPFEIDEEDNEKVNSKLRLQYRFIDLRRPHIQNLLQLKDKAVRHMRNYFHERGFIEVQTPILANPSPEGARDFLVPSRLHSGKFYALPQSPQQFKQLLMVGGLDRYFQIAPCFRDEDSRMDRHYGEFYQLDIEMSFVTQEDIINSVEPLMIELTRILSRKKIVNLDNRGRFKKISWHEAMNEYGSDKPDLRFEMKIRSVTDLLKGCDFTIFTRAIREGGVIHALKVDRGATFSRKNINELARAAKNKGLEGLSYIAITEKGELKSPMKKFLGDEFTRKIIAEVGAKAGDIIFFAAGKRKVVCESLGAVRTECALRLGLIDKSKAAWCWITDFPMYCCSEGEPEAFDFKHNPFSLPQGGFKDLEKKHPLDILAYQYDLVLNGFEISSGAIRNHDIKTMYKAFEIAGYSKEEVDQQFRALVQALQYGCPPHGGIAAGLDRILMVLSDLDSIRDVYAFPKDGAGKDLMMDSPDVVDKTQLEDVNIKVG
ncbi:MAG: Aspartate--tRNA ligase [Syntrophorhabdus sp. PtaU1.Bin002]|nr:MAG: Aspartate--tRNA ligase [Syntrophorhabdus sp. PtaU1.Bin002]